MANGQGGQGEAHGQHEATGLTTDMATPNGFQAVDKTGPRQSSHRKSHPVERPAAATAHGRYQSQRKADCDQPEWHVQEEDPAPGSVGRNQTSERRAEY